MELERRSLETAGLELRSEDGQPVIVGYAARYNELSEDLGGFREMIAPGAFDKAIGSDVRALFNHDPSLVLGRTTAGTLSLSSDDAGLVVRIAPPDTQAVRDLIVSMRRGDINQMSFGFRTTSDHWETKNGEAVRTLKDVRLFDVSVVTFPAYQQTSVAVRSWEQWRASQPKRRSVDTLQKLVQLL